ncbi:MAG: hypothetical protein ACFB0G_11205 [Leptolyngbyaceae cyanobacterium]
MQLDVFIVSFPSMFATLMWEFSESSGIPLGEYDHAIFGLMIGAEGVSVDRA